MATDYTAHANIVSWWMMEEESGTRYDGHATNNNDLTDNATVGYSSDSKQGTNSADFANDGEYLSILDNAHTGLDITGSLTFVCWIKATALPSGSHYLQIKYTDTNNCYMMRHTSGVLRVYIGDGSSFQSLDGQAALNTATWYHVAYVFDAGNNIHLYINGSTNSPGNTAATALTGIANNSAAFCLSYSAGYSFDGLMDEVAIFNTALNSADINSIIDYGLDGSGDVSAYIPKVIMII